jgi:RimJ/RimL family protein N-acetyltransferase
MPCPSPEPPPPWVAPRPLPIPLLTDRLRLDWWRPEDAPSLWQAIEESRSSMIPWLPWAATGHRDPEETLERIEAWTRKRQAPEPDDFFFGLFDRSTGRIVGGTGFHRVIHDLGQAEIGYWVREARRGAGLCSEAVRAMVTSGFRDWGFRRIVIECAGRNAASGRVAEKAGLALEARLRQSRWIDQQGWDDTLLYGMLRDDWDVATSRPRLPRPPSPPAIR